MKWKFSCQMHFDTKKKASKYANGSKPSLSELQLPDLWLHTIGLIALTVYQ